MIFATGAVKPLGRAGDKGYATRHSNADLLLVGARPCGL